MPTFRAPRGTRDLLPPETATWTRLERLAADLAARYGYRRIETPMFELTDVFERGVGEVTDIMEKELFRLAPRTEDGEAWALRPEPTAGIARAYVQHGMQTWPQPVKLSEIGSMFRYDRPQAGRYRQFWQFDIEAIGDAGPAIDAEIIELGSRFYREAGLEGVVVHLNSIGDAVCRPAYVAELTDYFRAHVAELPELERGRLERNVLRLLDSHDPAMAALNEAAPKITDRLCDACAEHFAGVRAHLDALHVPYRLEPGLVRGLDYYTRTAFEFYVTGREGQQQAVGGGGRYDGLVELMGGRPTPGHRVRDRPRSPDPCPDRDRGARPRPKPARSRSSSARIRPTRPAASWSPRICEAAGIAARAELGQRKLGKQLEAAAREHAHFAVIIGDELADGEVGLRDLPAGTQKLVAIDDLAREIGRAHGAHRHG